MARTRNPSSAAAEKLATAQQTLERGLVELTTSSGWTSYLRAAAKLHNYSMNNLILIWCQNPKARTVAGYNTWKTLNRHVKKGEHGITIIAPVTTRVDDRKAPDKPGTDDSSTGRTIVGFRTATVFDISQTDITDPAQPDPLTATSPVQLQGDDHPKLRQTLTDFATSRGFTITVVPANDLPPQALGQTTFNPRAITISEEISGTQALKTLVHEIGHALLHDPNVNPDVRQLPRGQVELEAESTAYMVMHANGIDSSNYSWAYIAGWAETINTDDPDGVNALLRASLDRILHAAREIITATQPPKATAEQTQAVTHLAQTAAIKATQLTATPNSRPLALSVATDVQPLYDANALAMEYYTRYGRADVAAEYLASRGITSTPPSYLIGYAPYSGLATYLADNNITPDIAERAGLISVTDTGAHDRFRNRLVIAYQDDRGIFGFIGRDLGNSNIKYLNSPTTEIYRKGNALLGLAEHRTQLSAGAIPAVVEGPLDALAIARITPPSQVAPLALCGTALTDQHIHTLARHSTSRTIIVALDDDPAGHKATRHATSLLNQSGWEVLVPHTISGQDPAELAATDPAALRRWIDPTNCHPGLVGITHQLIADTGPINDACDWQVSFSFIGQLLDKQNTDPNYTAARQTLADYHPPCPPEPTRLNQPAKPHQQLATSGAVRRRTTPRTGTRLGL